MGWLQDIRVVSIVGGQSIEEQGFKLRQVGSACHLFSFAFLEFKLSDKKHHGFLFSVYLQSFVPAVIY